jgi:chitinase
MINRLHELIRTASKDYLITGAPQCVVPDANMGQMIAHAKFDIIWVQYYNTPQCSARNWVTANPNYTITGVEEHSGFSFSAWENFLVGTESQNAKLYIGLPGAGDPTWYLSPIEASSLIKSYYCKQNFGGVMLWEATSAENNDVGCGETYYEAVKDILEGYSQDGALSCVIPQHNPKPTSSKASCTVTSTTATSIITSSITPTPPCTQVYEVVSGDYCYLIWTKFGITEAQLHAWNPTLDSNCDLRVAQILCVAESSTNSSTASTGVSATTTSTSASAAPAGCAKTYTVISGNYCYAIWTEFGLTEAQLYALNPTLDGNCDLSIGQVLCVSASPTSTSSPLTSTSTTSTFASSTPTACTKYYTVVSGDYCYLIYAKLGLTEAQLYAFNPTLDSNCNLSIGQVLCISESLPSTSTSSSTSTIASTTTSSTLSTPTAACTKYYTVVSGDYCYRIYTNFGITFAQLYALNPSLDANCDLSIGHVLCVSQSPVSSLSSYPTQSTVTSSLSLDITTSIPPTTTESLTM